MAIFVGDPDARPRLARGIQERLAGGIQFAGKPRPVASIRPEALAVVIQVRQINEGKIGWPAGAGQHFGCATSDPLGAGQAGRRPPEGAKRKVAKFLFQVLGHAVRRAQDIESLVAVRSVVRLGSDADIDRRALVEPPEQLGAAKGPAPFGSAAPGGHIDRLRLQQPIGLLPETDLAGFTKEPAVADDAVPRRCLPGQHGGLGGACDSGKHFTQGPLPARLGQRAQARRQRQALRGQGDGVDEDQGLHIIPLVASPRLPKFWRLRKSGKSKLLCFHYGK